MSTPHGAPAQEPEGAAAPKPSRPDAPAPDAALALRASRLSMRFVVLLILTMVSATLPVPWQLLGIAAVIGALVVGGMAIHATWAAGTRGAAIPVLSTAMALALVTGVSLVASLAFWDEQVERQTCLTSAVTISARATCEARYTQQIEQRLSDLTGSLAGDA